MTSTRGYGALLATVLALTACPSKRAALLATSGVTSFDLRKAQLRRDGASPDLVAKLEASRFRYFRMLAEAFELRTCDAFRDIAPTLPVAPVHGDPHLEQFVVTDTTFGLEDFDRAGFGPAVVDLVRYSAGLHVACSEAQWPCDANAAVDRFLAAYRGALAKAPTAREPSLVQRMRAKAPRSRASWLAWADALMVPLRPADEADVRRSWDGFRAEMREIRPDWSPSTYDVVRVGSLSFGFGSVFERKLLIRIAGKTASPDDDVIVEARQGITSSARSCVWRASYGESLILLFRSMLGRRMPDIHGFAPLPGSERQYWLQSWDPGYVELSIHDITRQSELEELAIDAAQQLAGYLWTRYPESLRPYQRHAQLKAFDATRARVVTLARALASASNDAWERFRSDRGSSLPVQR